MLSVKPLPHWQTQLSTAQDQPTSIPTVPLEVLASPPCSPCLTSALCSSPDLDHSLKPKTSYGFHLIQPHCSLIPVTDSLVRGSAASAPAPPAKEAQCCPDRLGDWRSRGRGSSLFCFQMGLTESPFSVILSYSSLILSSFTQEFTVSPRFGQEGSSAFL